VKVSLEWKLELENTFSSLFFFKFEAWHIVCFYYRSNFLKKLHQEYCMTEKIRRSWEIVRHWTKNVSELKTAILGYIVKVFTFYNYILWWWREENLLL
jgi:hypothetical protein